MKAPTPLRNIPIGIVVDGVEVRGTIATLYPNDLTVVITEPITGLSTGVHIPYFAMHVRKVATTASGQTLAITPRGQEVAECLLLRCYDFWRGEYEGWPVDGLGPEGWIRLPGDRAVGDR